MTDRTTRAQHAAAGAGSVRSWGASHTGAVRHVNQDRFLARDDLGLWLVADGAGGHQGGGMAAQALVEEFGRLDGGFDEAIVDECTRALQKTHLILRGFGPERNRRAMSLTTVVVLTLRGDALTCQWAGDSRAYRFRSGQLTLLTRDHSLVQELIDSGRIAASEAVGHPQRHIITRAVGADCETLDIASVTARAERGDFYLLCSDGLPATLPESQIAAAFDLAPERIADELIQAALAKKASDNITAVVVSVGHAAPG